MHDNNITNLRDKHNRINVYHGRYKHISLLQNYKLCIHSELIRSNKCFYKQLLSHITLLTKIRKDLCNRFGLSQLIEFMPSNEAITNTLLQLEVMKAHPSLSHPAG